jgi:para-aminobenzoate synthetase component 1
MNSFIEKANYFAQKNEPFVFLIDFEMENPLIFPVNEAEKNGILYHINGNSNIQITSDQNKLKTFNLYPLDFSIYTRAFDFIKENIKKGNTYLSNLTFATELITEYTLVEIFKAANAPYKVYKHGEFTFFSPECFIKIQDGKIFSYPMKGTIDAEIPNAEQLILSDSKELFEHYTIVDLIRNDLAMISTDVKVNKFRFIDRINSNNKSLLQVSSEIEGKLSTDWKYTLGDIIWKLLPAGSISGAPKKKTVEIIKEAEKDKRGYYTGIFGLFDGQNLDSCVNIRFVEQKNDRLFYRSGGGITDLSEINSEYLELKKKIYVPVV